MKKIAITGTMASGKSEMSLFLRNMGYPVFDCDGYSRITLHKNHPAYAQIVEAFGEGILSDTKEIDRYKLSAVVFSSPENVKKLNSITHPYIKEGLEKAMQNCGNDLFFAEVPLLFEAGWEDMFDEIAMVTCDRDVAIQRCIENRNYTKEEAIARLDQQDDPKKSMEKATKVFHNNGSIASFKKEIRQWIMSL